MSTEKPRITIAGLGLIGGSIGLALRQSGLALQVVGHDREGPASQEAKRLGAVDRTDWNLISACEKADLVILAMPLGAVQETLKAIGPGLRPGSVVLDTVTLKAPVLAWAAEALPEGVQFVGGDPILSGTLAGQGGLAAARADLFQKGLFCLMPSPQADSAAVKLVTDLVSILGARPLFLDPAEHDGLMAMMEHLPALLSLAALETAASQPTWRELRKMAGPAFESATRLLDTNPAPHAELYLANRQNIVRWLDLLSASLVSIRQTLAEEAPEALASRFEKAFAERQKWLADRAEGRWEESVQAEMPPKMSIADSLFGTFWRREPKRRPRD